eukprot:7028151-Pyramimonas_sp.AAC.1
MARRWHATIMGAAPGAIEVVCNGLASAPPFDEEAPLDEPSKDGAQPGHGRGQVMGRAGMHDPSV